MENCRAAILAAVCFLLAAKMTALQFLVRECDAELPQLIPLWAYDLFEHFSRFGN
jgi:hypothetical protein